LSGGSGRLFLHGLNEFVCFSNGTVHVSDELIELSIDFNPYAVTPKTDPVMHHIRSREEGEGPNRRALIGHIFGGIDLTGIAGETGLKREVPT
jgi:hypothetical protein